MKFGPVPLAEAEGKILAHNISDASGRRVLRKGRTVNAAHLDTLRSLGYERVFVAQLEEDDVGEDEAAERVARVVAGSGVESSSAHAGRVNASAATIGVVLVDARSLSRLNEIEGVTVATLATHTVVRPGQRVATVKIIPYAIPSGVLSALETGDDAISGNASVVRVASLPPSGVSVILVGSRGSWPGLREGLGAAIARRIEALGCRVLAERCSPLAEDSLTEALVEETGRADLVVLGGETAIMDPNDLIPRALRGAGGKIEHLGLPMDPGHLLLLGYLGDVPVVGAPGCVRGSNPDGFDAVVPRLLAGERLTGGDLEALGHGGLLSDPRGG